MPLTTEVFSGTVHVRLFALSEMLSTFLRLLGRRFAPVALCCCAITAAASGQVTIPGFGGASVALWSSGSWTISLTNPAWTFGGSLGGAAKGIVARTDSDRAGSFEEIDYFYNSASGARSGYIRAYVDFPAILFSTTLTNEANNSGPLTSFSSFPNLFRLAFSGEFSLPYFAGTGADSPWVYFDVSGNAFIVSPASNFMVASMTQGPGGSIDSGITNQIGALPAGLTHATAFVYGAGIDSTIQVWGRFLTSLSGKKRPSNDADTLLKQISYWTDNTATYYYNAGGPSYTDTLASIKAEFNAKGVALGSVQLDSWWYPKGPDNNWSSHGGIWTYNAARDLFPDDLSGFKSELGLPLITHARWIDQNSPLRGQYATSGNVIVDPAWWEVVASYLQASGVKTFEQDWLGADAHADVNLTDPFSFMDNMAGAMARHGITLQYCMGEPKHFLQSTLYNNASTARTSQDGFSSARWTEFLYSGRFASAVGLWPFTDVFQSADTNNMIMAVLSAGPVGVGDALGSLSRANLLKAARPDGVIVKPDVPAAPLDGVYIADAQGTDVPMTTATLTDYGGLAAHFIFSYVRQTNNTVTINPSAFGISGASYLYDYRNAAGTLLGPGASFTVTLASGSGYFVLVPVGRSGIGFLGDKGQFVTLGKKRVSGLSDQGHLDATVAFAAGERTRILFGYSPQPVAATALAGSVAAVSWDPATQLFTLNVHPGPNGVARVRVVQSFLSGDQTGPAAGCGLRCIRQPTTEQ
jgi:hypothetical protein